MTDTNNKKVVSAVRDSIINAAKEAQLIKQKTTDLAKKVEKGWVDSKPSRDKAATDIQKAAQSIVDFGKDVAQGVKEGMSEIQKKTEK